MSDKTTPQTSRARLAAATASPTQAARACLQASQAAPPPERLAHVSDVEFMEAHDALVNRIVFDLRARFHLDKAHLDDMMADARVGLLEARERFDADQGTAFGTFAYYRIRGNVVDGLRRSGVLRRRDQTRASLDHAQALLQEDRHHTAAPTRSSVARSLAHVDRTIASMGMAWMVIHDAHEHQHAANTRQRPSQLLLKREEARLVHAALDALPELERDILRGVYYEERNLSDLGRERGYSRSWVCRVHARALENLRAAMDAIERDGLPPPDG